MGSLYRVTILGYIFDFFSWQAVLTITSFDKKNHTWIILAVCRQAGIYLGSAEFCFRLGLHRDPRRSGTGTRRLRWPRTRTRRPLRPGTGTRRLCRSGTGTRRPRCSRTGTTRHRFSGTGTGSPQKRLATVRTGPTEEGRGATTGEVQGSLRSRGDPLSCLQWIWS